MSWSGLAAWAANLPPAVIGMACGAGAALCWAAGLVSARHGILIGLSPLDITFHRLVFTGLFFLPSALRGGSGDPGGVGWGRSISLAFFSGPPLALLSYAGLMLVPLGHGGVIQPSSAALGGLVLSTVVLKERLLPTRVAGAIAIVCGLCLIGYEALSTMGTQLKLWKVTPIHAVAVTSVVSLVLVPVQFIFGFDRMIAAGLFEMVLMALVQGIFAGAAATFLFTRAVVVLGASRAAVFPALVPPFTLLIGFLALGNVPSAYQLAGLTIVLIGFRLTQKS